MTERPAISVLLPTRNGERTIGRQLDALARQSWGGSWEVIVIDNGSTDGTLGVVTEHAERLPELRVIAAAAKRGLPFACNTGVSEARADRIAICNDDDEVGEGWVEAMARALADHELVAGRLEYDRLNEAWIVEVRGRPQEAGLLHWSFGTHLPFAAGAALGMTRALHEGIGGFDEEMVPAGEDMDFCWRAQYSGAQPSFVPDAVTHYRLRHDWGEIYRQGRNYGIGNVLAYRKHLGLGMAPISHPWRTGARGWLAVARQGLRAVDRVGRGRFLWYLGWRVGMLETSVRHRVVLL